MNSISIPRGQGYTNDIKSNIEGQLRNIGYDKKINYSPKGADIIAENQDEIWKVECKGLGSGAEGTLRTNFDRALASVVTYFDNEDKKQFLALAIPNSLFYLQQLSRISKPLWILLIDESEYTIIDYKPDDDDDGIKKLIENQTKLRKAIAKALKRDPELLKKIQRSTDAI